MVFGRVRRGLGLGMAAALVAGLPSLLSSPVAAATGASAPMVSATPVALAVKAAKPKITGVVAVGSTLTAVPGQWASKAKLSFQWFAAGVAIKQATKRTFKLTKAEAGRPITVTVTGRLGGSTTSKTSSATANVLLAATPKILGTVFVGSTLTVSRGTWTSAVKFSYAWLRDGLAVPGATGASHQVAESDAGHKLSVRVTGKRAGYASVSKASAVVTVPDVLPPTITGTPLIWSTLTVDPGTWAPGTAVSVQWLRNGAPIVGATTPTYSLVSDDVKQLVSAAVTGKLGSLTTTRISAAVPIPAGALPTIAGTAVVGSTLTADPSGWATGTELSYQWLRNGTVIDGATDLTYKLTAADGKQQLSVAVTGKFGSESATRTSEAMKVSNQTLQSATPTITGTAKVGKTLTADAGAWTPGTLLSYQWFADGVAVTRGTSSQLRPGYLEAGRKLTVTVTGTSPGYDTVTKTSAATPSVPTDAVYTVGIDIPAGTFGAAGSGSCYWMRSRLVEGPPEYEDVLGYRSIAYGPALATILPSDVWFYATGCGSWTTVSDEPSPKTSFGDGDYLVGSQLKPGIYDTIDLTRSCYVELASGAEGTDAEIRESFTNPLGLKRARVLIPSALARVSSQGCGTWRWVADLIQPPDPIIQRRTSPPPVSPLYPAARRPAARVR